jgi:CubicO group peptidase (beta-lactamase class C family)
MKSAIKIFWLLFIFLCFLALIACHTQTNEDPENAWKTSTPEQQGMDSQELMQMLDFIESSGEDVHSVLIIRNGYLVLEAYYYPYNSQIIHMQASATKSFTSTLVGIAIDKGYISGVDQKVLAFFPDYTFKNNNDLKQSMKLKHLLTMSSGLDWNKTGKNDNPEKIFTQKDDPVQYTLDRPMAAKPGTVWTYSGGNSHLLAAIVTKTTEEKVEDFAKQNLFDPLGITNYVWEKHWKSGVNIGCAGLYIRPRDMAKLGYLYLNRGKWNGKTIVSSQWIKEATTRLPIKDYGYQFWVDPELKLYKAWGFGGQHIAVLPDLNIVAVFTGGVVDSSMYPFHRKLYKDYIIKSVKSSQPLPENLEIQKEIENRINNIRKEPERRDIVTLPEKWKEISGKKYLLDSNIFDFKSFSFEFNEGKGEGTIDLDFSFIKGEFPIGLDNVYRTKKIKLYNTPIAIRGNWIDSDSFEFELLNVVFGYRYFFVCHFEGKTVKVDASSPILNLKETFIGKR